MAESQLSAVLTAACLVLIFVVRKLGLVISQRDSLSTSQQAMLKQVRQGHTLTSFDSNYPAALLVEMCASVTACDCHLCQAILDLPYCTPVLDSLMM